MLLKDVLNSTYNIKSKKFNSVVMALRLMIFDRSVGMSDLIGE